MSLFETVSDSPHGTGALILCDIIFSFHTRYFLSTRCIFYPHSIIIVWVCSKQYPIVPIHIYRDWRPDFMWYHIFFPQKVFSFHTGVFFPHKVFSVHTMYFLSTYGSIIIVLDTVSGYLPVWAFQMPLHWFQFFGSKRQLVTPDTWI